MENRYWGEGFDKNAKNTRVIGSTRFVDTSRKTNYSGINRHRNNAKYVTTNRKYTKEATIKINDIDIIKYRAHDVIDSLEEICGKNTVLAVVPNKEDGLSYEITLDTVENAHKLHHGIEINGEEFQCNFQQSDIIVVSFLYIPSYVEDEELLSRLRSKNIEIVSDVYRRVHPGTQVADGTRFVRVKFPPGLVSLAWSMSFETAAGKRYFKVVHNNQVKVCSNCESPEHVKRNCPHFSCHGCGMQGHKSSRCAAPKCHRCGKLPLLCACPIIINNSCNKNHDEREEVNNEKDEIRCQKCDGACNCSDTEVVINTKLPKQHIEEINDEDVIPCVKLSTDEKKEVSENMKGAINVEIHAGSDSVSKDKDANESSLISINGTGGTPMQEVTEDCFDVAEDTTVNEEDKVGGENVKRNGEDSIGESIVISGNPVDGSTNEPSVSPVAMQKDNELECHNNVVIENSKHTHDGARTGEMDDSEIDLMDDSTTDIVEKDKSSGETNNNEPPCVVDDNSTEVEMESVWELPSDNNTSVGKMKKSNKNNKSINRRRKLQVKPNVHGVNVKSKFNPYK